MRTGTRRFVSTGWLALGLAALVTVGCDKVQLTAPGNSTITLSAPTRMLPTGGSTELSATVFEDGGTPVQNGTTVRFSTNLGRVDPVETQTRNGVATTVFFAGDVSGAAEVKAVSGANGGPSGTNTTATNAVTILVGAAAVESVSVRASAGSVPATGGTVDIIATVIAQGGTSGGTAVPGGPLGGIPVTFNTTAGTLSGTREVSDGNGEARTRLTTDTTATVTATAGTKTSTPGVTITALNPVPTPTITLAGTGATATPVGQLFTFTATVANNTAVGTPVKFEWNFGDGLTAESNGPSQTHVYTEEEKVFTVTVRAVFANNTSISASTQIITSLFP